MKILLLAPCSHEVNIADRDVYVVEPLGLEIVATALADDHDVEIVDLRLEPALDIAEKIAASRPDVVGVSAWVFTRNQCLDLLGRVKALDPTIFTVVGGHHATTAPEEFNFPGIVDAIVVGEGARPFRGLAAHLSRSEVPPRIRGVLYPREDGRLEGSAEKYLPELDAEAPTRRDLVDRYRGRYHHLWWSPIALLRASSGCPYRCNYCTLWRYTGGKYVTASVERVADEVESRKEPFIAFADDNLLHDVPRAFRFAEELARRGIDKQYVAYSRSDTIAANPKLVEAWAKAGLRRVRIGLEACSDATLKSLNKCNTAKNNSDAIDVLRRNGVLVEGIFMVQPEFERDDFRRMGDFILEKGIEIPMITIFTPMPGTDQYRQCYDRIRYHNRELYDFNHLVLPSRLPEEEFYLEYFKLQKRIQMSPFVALKLMGVKRFAQHGPRLLKFVHRLKGAHRHAALLRETVPERTPAVAVALG